MWRISPRYRNTSASTHRSSFAATGARDRRRIKVAIDLTLLPFDHEAPGSAFSHTILGCNGGGTLYEQIDKLDADPVPLSFRSYLSRDDEWEEAHYGETHETPYGAPLTCVSAKCLLRFRDQEEVAGNAKNRAVWAYLAELPPETRVALFWH